MRLLLRRFCGSLFPPVACPSGCLRLKVDVLNGADTRQL
jgi:hypothetical protein